MKKLIFLTLLLGFSFTLSASLKDVEFFSYGRIGFSANPVEGSSGTIYNVVSNSSRIELNPYQELGIKYNLFDNKENGIDVDLYFTLAFESYNHYTGDFSVKSAIRQFYADFRNVFTKGLNLWVGSRLYRGDDIYLFNLWPLDNLNTYGAGIVYDKEKYTIKAHIGVNRLNDPEYQYGSGYFDEDNESYILDRQRYIASLNFIMPVDKFKFKLYGEFHGIGSDTFYKNGNKIELPSDKGFVVGAQITHSFAKKSFAKLYLRYAKGLPAYGEGDRTVPFGNGDDKKAWDANNFFVGVDVNYEIDKFGLMFAAYYRYFSDADDAEYDHDDFHEGIFDIRGIYYATDIFHIDLDLSVQFRKTMDLDAISNTENTPIITKIALMPTISPKGWGNYFKPDFRLIYVYSYLNEGAAHELAPSSSYIKVTDNHKHNHYLGVMSEWWF